MNENFWMDGIDFDDELSLGWSDLNPLKHVASAVDAVVPGAGKFVDPIGSAAGAVLDRMTGGGAPVRSKGSGITTALSGAKAAIGKRSIYGRVGDMAAITKRPGPRISGAGTPMQQRDDISMVLARALASRDAIGSISARPKLAAKKVTSGYAGGKGSLLANVVANAVAKKLGPDLAMVNKRLRLAANQRTATSEHLNINNKTAFRRKVLQDLLRISATLPASHPIRQRIRKVGLFSGLL